MFIALKNLHKNTFFAQVNKSWIIFGSFLTVTILLFSNGLSPLGQDFWRETMAFAAGAGDSLEKTAN
jgi:lipopolysaccharide export LptBFGC system permease protein LptF